MKFRSQQLFNFSDIESPKADSYKHGRTSILRRRLKSHFSSTLVSNSYVILAIRLVGPGGSLLFWAIAARTLDPKSVGLASGIIAAAALLAGLAQLGMGYGLVRYLPDINEPSRLLNLTFEAVSAAALLLALSFIAGLEIWSPALTPLRQGALPILAFCVLVVTASLTQLFNEAFLARRKPIYSLYKNALQTTLSIFILLILATWIENYLAALLAYALSLFIVAAISIGIFLPRTDPTFYIKFTLPRKFHSPFSKFALANYISDQLQRSPNNLITLLVVNILGPVSGAYFFAAWALVSGLSSLAGSVPRSLFAEGSNEPEQLTKLTHNALKLGLLFAGGMAMAAALFSKWIISIYGPDYYKNSQELFLLLLLSIIPATVVLIFLNAFRVQKKLKLLIIITGVNLAISLLLTYIFANLYGLNGAGFGWLVANLVILILIIVMWIRRRE